MSVVGRIGAFAALLVVVFAAAAFAGSRIDPDVSASGSHNGVEMMGSHQSTIEEAGTADHEDHEGTSATEALPPGLAVAQNGYRLDMRTRSASADTAESLQFRILNEAGSVVRDFDVQHKRRMHLIIVRPDFQGFQHLHPEQSASGNWTVTADDLLPGVYRVFADFSSEGESLTLASDLFVPGQFEPKPLESVSNTSDAGDGYEVTIESPRAIGGGTARTVFEVFRNGRKVDEVQPYLGADGHLVALRDGDLAFLHAHPEGEPGGNGPIAFEVNYPTVGRYRLFLQFKHDGQVHTAAFTQVARPANQEGGAVNHG